MPNPGGVNQFQGFTQPEPYGMVKRIRQLTQQAPMSGAPAHALNTPERAGKQAARGRTPGPQMQPQSPPAQPPPDQPYPAMLAEIARSLPGADGTLSHIAWLASKAAREAANG